MIHLQSAFLKPYPKIVFADPQISGWKSRGRRRNSSVKAVLQDGEVRIETAAKSQLQEAEKVILPAREEIQVRAVVTIRKKVKYNLRERLAEQWDSILYGIGQGILIQLVSEDIDPVSGSAKISNETAVRGWPARETERPHHVEFAADFTVPADFGRPGAILVSNAHNSEIMIAEIAIQGFDDGPIFFPAHTWIQPQTLDPKKRIIFSNQMYLPDQTPEGLKKLRQEDLENLRGNGKGERKSHERIYDYAVYNDLGNPDKSESLTRPVLGGKEIPYPRRCRTGRPPMKSNTKFESRIEKPNPVYVPRDETFEDIKLHTMTFGKLKAVLHNLIPIMKSKLSSTDRHFISFSEIELLYKKKDNSVVEDDEQTSQVNEFSSIFKKIFNIDEPLKYDIPLIISRDRLSWLNDSEFARQMLAGVNPCNIKRLKEFPIMSSLNPEEYGLPESALTVEIIEKELNGMTVEKAIEEKRLFILDYHDVLLPFIKKMNSLKDRKAYASRTIFFHAPSGILRPIAIELSLPRTTSEPRNKKVYTHGHDATGQWLWRLAKAHVCSNDVGVHQLVNHWLKTHACMEPYIIAAHRQLSQMHPVFKLLHPHMRYTMEINALARQSLINGGGIIEAGFSPGQYAMEISAAAYKNLWRFDMEALPADLVHRGMAEEDPTSPHGIKLVIEDYPYAADGLLIWSAIESYVTEYLSLYYPSPSAISSDTELQSWWTEVQTLGHPDKRHEPWWPTLTTLPDLVRTLTTIIWTASGQHAAVNFGQYPLGGYMPNRPALMKKLIAEEGTPEYKNFIRHPQEEFLSSLPTQLEATQIMAVQDSLSTHSADEEYLGQIPEGSEHWVADQRVVAAFEKFSSSLDEVEKVIKKRNKDSRLKNRSGAGIPPYELMVRSSGPGATGKGIPNSISI